MIPQEYINKMSIFYQKAKESSFEDVKLQIEETSGMKLEDLFDGKQKNLTPERDLNHF